MPANLYAILGVGCTATPNEIKSAYRRLARKYHPDVNHDAAAASKFAQISDAYHVLIDDQKRRIYDRTGEIDIIVITQDNSPAARAARRVYYQAQADKIVNDWLQREREETRVRRKAVYTTVTLFLSTIASNFLMSMINFSFSNVPSPWWIIVFLILFGFGVHHLFSNFREQFDHYTYTQTHISIIRSVKSTKPFRRSEAFAFIIGGYIVSLITGILIGLLTNNISYITLGDALVAALLFPPIAVLIMNLFFIINTHFEEL